MFLRLYGGKIKIDTQQGLVCATYNSPEEFAQRDLSQRLVPRTVYTNRFEEQGAGTCPKNSTQFQFVRMVAETKVWCLRLDLKQKMPSSYDGTCFRDLLQGAKNRN